MKELGEFLFWDRADLKMVFENIGIDIFLVTLTSVDQKLFSSTVARSVTKNYILQLKYIECLLGHDLILLIISEHAVLSGRTLILWRSMV